MTTLEQKARALMRKQTLKNKAPTWALTEIAIKKGEELSKKHKANKELVTVSLYLAHTIFSTKIGGSIQKNHEALSAKLAAKYLKLWNVPQKKQEIILNSILAHHNKTKGLSKEAEVMKNAECWKFLTPNNAAIYLQDLRTRGLNFEKATAQLKKKMTQKLKLVTLKDVHKEAMVNYKAILKILE